MFPQGTRQLGVKLHPIADNRQGAIPILNFLNPAALMITMEKVGDRPWQGLGDTVSALPSVVTGNVHLTLPAGRSPSALQGRGSGLDTHPGQRRLIGSSDAAASSMISLLASVSTTLGEIPH